MPDSSERRLSLARAPFGEREWEARVALSAAYRIAALEGLDDGVFNHFSAAVPDEPGRFLLKPFGPLFEETTASGLIKVDLNGEIVDGHGAWEPTAFFIHSRIHQAIPRAACVMHAHMPYATALASLADNRIKPMNQSSMRFVTRTGYLDSYGGLVLDTTESDQIVTALGEENDVVMLANHGVMVIGASIAEALYDLHYLEIACRDQLLAMGSGAPLRLIDDATTAHTAAQMVEERKMAAEPHLRAMMRRLDRLNPGYRA